MRNIRVLTMVGILVATFMAAACGSNSPGPTAPTPSPTPAPTPAPTPSPTPSPTTGVLTGTISNTAGLAVSGATVTVIDGPNAGATAVSNANGTYLFNALTLANTNFSATASGYFESRAGIFVDGKTALNFVLTPVPPPPPPAPAITITSRIISGGTGTPTQEWGFSATSTATFVSYDWDFGDGGHASNSTANEQHVYRAFGTFTVTVTATPASGSPVVGTLVITVQ